MGKKVTKAEQKDRFTQYLPVPMMVELEKHAASKRMSLSDLGKNVWKEYMRHADIWDDVIVRSKKIEIASLYEDIAKLESNEPPKSVEVKYDNQTNLKSKQLYNSEPLEKQGDVDG